MDATATLIERNQAYAEDFDRGGLASPPALKIAIVTCMDARLHPAKAFGLDLGDAHVIRNAGGVVTDDVIRSVSISQHHLGTTEVMVVHHTQCGMLTFTDEDFAQALEQEAGERPTWAARTFQDLEEDVRDGVQRIRQSPFIPHRDNVRGFVYDVATGQVHEVG
jgi:carbonic anhydrase